VTPKWLFFPSPPATGVKLQLDAELVATARADRFNVTNTTLSGSDDVANNYLIYTFGPIRKSTTYIEWLFSLDSSGDYANAGDWETAVTNAGNIITASSTWIHDSATFGATSVTHTHGSNAGTVVRVRWNGSSTDVDNFWNTLAGGETTQIKLNWS
jgi:hypothetical protein